MINTSEVIEVLKSDKNFAKLLANAKETDALANIGFDSLDNMLISHLIEQAWQVKLEILGTDSISSITEKVNAQK